MVAKEKEEEDRLTAIFKFRYIHRYIDLDAQICTEQLDLMLLLSRVTLSRLSFSKLKCWLTQIIQRSKVGNHINNIAPYVWNTITKLVEW